MFQLIIIPNNTSANVALWFKTREDAVKMKERIARLRLATSFEAANEVAANGFSDDYGHTLEIWPKDISYTLILDLFQEEMLKFDQNMAKDKAMQEIEKKLAELGFARSQPRPQKSTIIRS